ncbi:Uncharacterised protein [Mycobacteroides abscessus]|nr:Uncharacterised protein [Mycobacteroides abscessus]
MRTSASTTATKVSGMRMVAGARRIAASGSSPPTVNDTIDATAASHGLVSSSGSMCSSASACAASGSRSVSWTATWRATSGVRPFAS